MVVSMVFGGPGADSATLGGDRLEGGTGNDELSGDLGNPLGRPTDIGAESMSGGDDSSTAVQPPILPTADQDPILRNGAKQS
jgi:Ca2+-binding RTX toxin-like protein